MDTPRLGQISFLNCAPITLGLVHQEAIGQISVTNDTPVNLARRLAAGELDVAAISAIEYLKNADDYLLLPGVAISASGRALTASLVSRTAPDQISGTIAASDASTATRALLEILLAEQWKGGAAVETRSFSGDDVLGDADAALVIGDQALRIANTPPADAQITDLSAAWKELTGADMTFAVWAVRRDFAERDPQALAALAAALQGAVAWVADNRAQAASRLGWVNELPPELLTDYYELLRFDFDADARAGLTEFARRAQAHGLIENVPEPQFAEIREAAAQAA